MAIISASRRTDIPAFFTDWFMNRIREGYFLRINPFNPKQTKGVSLAPVDVDAIVFWSKNPDPLLFQLDELNRRGYRYYFQFTLNPYDRHFEPKLPPLEERIETFRGLADRIGPAKVVWRYDPIVLSSATPLSFHLDNVAKLAEALRGHTEQLVFSFLDFYGKVNNRLNELQRKEGITIYDITANPHHEELRALMTHAGRVGKENGMSVLSCAEELELSEFGIEHGSCIDGKLISRLFGIDCSSRKDKNQRDVCRCLESIDMGVYNTCSFQCSYCYANLTDRTINKNLEKHKILSPALIGDYQGPVEIKGKSSKSSKECHQGELF